MLLFYYPLSDQGVDLVVGVSILAKYVAAVLAHAMRPRRLHLFYANNAERTVDGSVSPAHSFCRYKGASMYRLLIVCEVGHACYY